MPTELEVCPPGIIREQAGIIRRTTGGGTRKSGSSVKMSDRESPSRPTGHGVPTPRLRCAIVAAHSASSSVSSEALRDAREIVPEGRSEMEAANPRSGTLLRPPKTVASGDNVRGEEKRSGKSKSAEESFRSTNPTHPVQSPRGPGKGRCRVATDLYRINESLAGGRFSRAKRADSVGDRRLIDCFSKKRIRSR